MRTDKICGECRQVKVAGDFSPKQSVCKSCRAIRRRLRYALRDAERPDTCQNPRCNLPPAHLDHDHLTGEWRGWLCGPCNIALGFMQDDPEAILGLSEYIRERRGKRLTKIHRKIKRGEKTKPAVPNVWSAKGVEEIPSGMMLCPSCEKNLMLDSWRSCFECWSADR